MTRRSPLSTCAFACALLSPLDAFAVPITHDFTWRGANDYSLNGTLKGVDSNSDGLIRDRDGEVTSLSFEAFFGGDSIGFGYADPFSASADRSFNLNFDVAATGRSPKVRDAARSGSSGTSGDPGSDSPRGEAVPYCAGTGRTISTRSRSTAMFQARASYRVPATYPSPRRSHCSPPVSSGSSALAAVRPEHASAPGRRDLVSAAPCSSTCRERRDSARARRVERSVRRSIASNRRGARSASRVPVIKTLWIPESPFGLRYPRPTPAGAGET